MILYDTHMHTEFSTDSDTPVTAQTERAEQAGLRGICITDHMDYDFPAELCDETFTGEPFVFDVDSYQRRLQKEKEQAPIDILCGVECGLQATENVINKNKKLAANQNWDFIIGSLHLVDKTDPYYDFFWEGKDARECVKEYFDSILDNLQNFSAFDSLGHFDYVVRYAPASFRYEPKQYMDLIDTILRLLIKKDIALEVNTGGWYSKCGCQNPHFDILQHYASLGGKLITIGSDAHTPEDISYRFHELPALLKKAGLRQYCVYQKRKPVFFDL